MSKYIFIGGFIVVLLLAYKLATLDIAATKSMTIEIIKETVKPRCLEN